MTSFFFFHDPATTEIYTLSLHDALPICGARFEHRPARQTPRGNDRAQPQGGGSEARGKRRDWRVVPRLAGNRSEEHTSELQSRGHLVCRLLLEKKKKKITNTTCKRSSHI